MARITGAEGEEVREPVPVLISIRHVRAIAMSALLSTALIAGEARAYRPFDLTDADVAKRRNIEVELGPAEFIGVDAEHSLRAPNFSVNYGIATGRELTFDGAHHIALNPEEGEPRSQFEDVGIAMKQVMRRGSLQDLTGPSVAIENEITFPGRGEKHLGAAAALIFSSASKRGSTHFNLEGERLPEGRNAGAVGMIFEASDKFGVAPAVELRVAAVDGGLPEHSVTAGLIYVPAEKTEYDVALRFARRGDEKTFEIRAGLTWQFSAQKVIEKVASKVGLPPPRRHRH
jgi:hypothetical protein